MTDRDLYLFTKYVLAGKATDRMKQRQCRVIGEATLSSLLLLGLLAPALPAAQIVGGNTESNAKGKPAAKADFVLMLTGSQVVGST
jgi:hypothetical protein